MDELTDSEVMYVAQRWRCHTNHRPAYIMPVFLMAVQMQIEKKNKPLKLCRSQENALSQGVTETLHGPKTPDDDWSCRGVLCFTCNHRQQWGHGESGGGVCMWLQHSEEWNHWRSAETRFSGAVFFFFLWRTKLCSPAVIGKDSDCETLTADYRVFRRTVKREGGNAALTIKWW